MMPSHRGAMTLIAFATLVLVDCDTPARHPENVEAVCGRSCAERRSCDPSLQVTACISECRESTAMRANWRPQYIQMLSSCYGAMPCDAEPKGGSCVARTLANILVSDPVLRHCEHQVKKDAECGIATPLTMCLENKKPYEYEVLSKLEDCLDTYACAQYGRCEEGVAEGRR